MRLFLRFFLLHARVVECDLILLSASPGYPTIHGDVIGEFAAGEKNSGTFAGFGGVEENEISSRPFSGSLFINERGIAFLFCLFAGFGQGISSSSGLSSNLLKIFWSIG